MRLFESALTRAMRLFETISVVLNGPPDSPCHRVTGDGVRNFHPIFNIFLEIFRSWAASAASRRTTSAVASPTS